MAHRISFQWILAHCGIMENEKAGILAKKGTFTMQYINRPLLFHITKLFVNLTLKKILKQDMIQCAMDKSWRILGEETTLTPSFPRKTAVALFRRLSGYDCLRDHLYRIGVVDSPNCIFMTPNCIALSQYEDIVKKYWRACELMA
ncbi:hypothetical protein X975_12405, partial [Stegodyphus mimosarum]